MPFLRINHSIRPSSIRSDLFDLDQFCFGGEARSQEPTHRLEQIFLIQGTTKMLLGGTVFIDLKFGWIVLGFRNVACVITVDQMRTMHVFHLLWFGFGFV
jgi:hypothetical protein